METELVMKAGLTQSQANTYIALIEGGEMTPAQLTQQTGETRTNTYAILGKLEKLKLVENIGEKQATYRACNPSQLEVLAERRRKIVSRNENELKEGMSGLLDIFYAHNEAPGSRTYIGVEGIKEAYRDVLRTGQTVYLLRTVHDEEFTDFIWSYRDEMVKKGVKTIALTPDTAEGRKYQREGVDEKYLFERTMMPPDAYTAPVTVMVYGDKMAVISYGGTQIATITTSPTIAEAFRQVLSRLRDYYRETYKQD